MATSSTFTEIGSIEHEINFSEDDTVDDIFKESEGSLQVYITSTRQWMSSEQNTIISDRSTFLGILPTPNRPIFLGKIQTPATEVFSTNLQFADLIDLNNNIKSSELRPFIEEIMHTFNVNPKELHNLLDDLIIIIRECMMDINSKKPREFEIEVFVHIISNEVCSKQEFKGKYGRIFRGPTDAIFMRSKRYLEEEEEEETCCGICSVEFLAGVDEVIVMPCSDVFHKMCIGRWLNEKSNSCPVCYWSPGISELRDSSSDLQQAKHLFDRLQAVTDAEDEISKCNIF